MVEEQRKVSLRQNNQPSIQGQQQNSQPPQQQQQSQAQQALQDIANWWPVFGRKTNGQSTTFWGKNPKKLLLEELVAESEEQQFGLKNKLNGEDDDSDNEVQNQGVNQEVLLAKLNRISKKTKATKTYMYAIKGKCLVYYKDTDEKKPYRGSLKLCSDVLIEKKKIQGKNGDIHYIEFLKDGNVRKLFSENLPLIQKVFEEIRQKCILQNFRDTYKKLELLGSGSFAVVFKVQRVSDNKIFAAKIIKKAKLEENKYKDKFVAMLINEYKVLSESNHANVIQMEEIYQDSNQLVYIMEFLTGGEIYARLRQVKHFSEEIAAEIMKNITEGLNHIHLKKTVHRDLKLENIMFVNKTDNDCKLIDFGFAEQINYEKLESRAGTPGFLPPELFKLCPYTDKGDVFSLGVILYCLVSGSSPFKGKTYKDVLENNRKCQISYDQPIWSKISEECKHLIRRMVEEDPVKRYSCIEILKSRWITKYFPSSPVSQKSFNTTKTGRSKKSKSKLKDSFEDDLNKESDEDSIEFDPSTMMNMHSENPKSFYRKSMRSIKSIKSQKSHFSHRSQQSSDDAYSEDKEHESHNKKANGVREDSQILLNKAQSEQIQGKTHNQNNHRLSNFKEDVYKICDIEDDIDEPSNLNQKIKTLYTPDKKFIIPLTQAASAFKFPLKKH